MATVRHGRGVTAAGALSLAQDFQESADHLAAHPRTNVAQGNPRRFLYLAAIETYLRAHLLAGGKSPEEVRNFQHDMATMLDACMHQGLEISLASANFVTAAAAAGDYVRTRYDLDLRDLSGQWPPPKRPNANWKLLISTTQELGVAVASRVLGSITTLDESKQ